MIESLCGSKSDIFICYLIECQLKGTWMGTNILKSREKTHAKFIPLYAIYLDHLNLEIAI